MAINVIFADDHEIIIEGFKTLLQKYGRDIKILATASNGQQVLELYEKHHPDICVLDIFMPVMNGIDTVLALRRQDPKAKVIILSTYHDKVLLEKAIKAGVKGYILKENCANEIIKAIHEVARDKFYLSPELSELMVRSFLGKPERNQPANGEDLSERELEVIKLVARGLSGKEIAAKLKISLNTVHSHRNSIMRKLDMHKQTEIVRYALERKIL